MNPFDRADDRMRVTDRAAVSRSATNDLLPGARQNAMNMPQSKPHCTGLMRKGGA